MFRTLITLALIAAPVAALAANDVTVVSDMFVEKTVAQPGAQPKIVLVHQKSGPPGTRLVFVHSYRNGGKAPAANFAMTNPMPSGVGYLGSDDASATVSVDGGKTFGPLATAKVRSASGSLRAATPDDVTHVHWALKGAIPVGGTGKFSFRGIVK